MIHPMLCQKGSEKDLDRQDWIAEIKFDGTRALIAKTPQSIMIQSRPKKTKTGWSVSDYTLRLPEIAKAVKEAPWSFTIDGEVVYTNSRGISEFTPCQRRCATQNPSAELIAEIPVSFVAFDVLQWEGKSVEGFLYIDRHEILEEFFQGLFNAVAPPIHVAKIYKDKRVAFNDIVSRGGEGVIAKNLGGIYQEGVRSYDWLKVKPNEDPNHEAVCDVVGYTEGESWRNKTFGSLVLAQNGSWICNVGSGFNGNELRYIKTELERALKIPKPFEIDEAYTAIQTDLKVVVRFQERTVKGHLRFPSFLRIVNKAIVEEAKYRQIDLTVEDGP